MKKELFKNIVIVILSVIVVSLSVALVLIYINMNNKFLDENGNVTNVVDNNKNEVISYRVEDYITIEKVDLGSDGINLEKVSFKNLDSSLVEDFVEEQTELLETAKSTLNYYNGNNFSIATQYVAISDIWYQINKDILTVYYKMTIESEIGTCERVIIVNINLKDKKIVTNEELLVLGNTNFHEIALENYNHTLESVKKCNDPTNHCGVPGKDGKLLKFEEYSSNKDKYVNIIESGLDDVISTYIQDGVIKYHYYGYSIDLLYLSVAKGGCFPYHVVELGEYK